VGTGLVRSADRGTGKNAAVTRRWSSRWIGRDGAIAAASGQDSTVLEGKGEAAIGRWACPVTMDRTRLVKIIILGCSLDSDRMLRVGAYGQDDSASGHHLTRARTFLAVGDQRPRLKGKGRMDDTGRLDIASIAFGWPIRRIW
jgi:hypothetical protein